MNVHSVFVQMSATTALTSFQPSPSQYNLSQASFTHLQVPFINHQLSPARRDRSVSLASFFRRTFSL